MKRHIQPIFFMMIFFFAISQNTFLPGKAAAAGRMKGSPFEEQPIPDELRAMDVKNHFIPTRTRPVGVIQTIKGNMVVIHGGTDLAFFAARGDRIFRNDILLTLKESRCRVRFDTEDLVTMGQNTRIDIDEMIDDRKNKRKRSVLNMLRGKAMFYVVRLFRYKKTTARVKTPTAICGVRGTKFGVEVIKAENRQAQSRPFYLADASGSGLRAFIAAAGQTGTKTLVHSFEGNVDVTSTADMTEKTIGTGDSLEIGAEGSGDVYKTPASVANEFKSTTKAPAPGDDGGKDTEEGSGDDSGDQGDDSAASDDRAGDDTNSDVEDKSLQASSDATEQSLTTLSGSKSKGYFAAMLSSCTPSLTDVYVNSARQTMDPGPATGGSIVNGAGYYMQGQGGFDNSAYLRRFITDNSGTDDSGDLGTSRPISDEQLGSNLYMDWGYWTMTQAVEINGTNYTVDNKAYYLVGQPTPDDAVNGISGHYEGTAYGTYYGDPVTMTGTFACDVNGSSGTVTNFTMDVANGSHNANITIGSGTFSGSSFNITSATWNLSGITTGLDKSCNGSLYGPNGEHIGGTWGMYYDVSSVGAVGVFQGSK